jgi:imidazolonepropionase-like amidohydrolase
MSLTSFIPDRTLVARGAILLFATVLLALVGLESPGATKGPARSYEIIGITVVNVNARSPATALLSNSTIILEGDRIASIRPTTQADLTQLALRPASPADGKTASQLIDGRGQFLIPGLIDTHVHLDWDGDETPMLKLLLANGVTSILEAGNSSEKVARLRRQSLSEDFVAPRMETSGAIITAAPAAQPGMTVVSTPKQVKQALTARVLAGSHFAKIYAQLPPALTFEVIQQAQRRGMRVVGHLGRTNALEATAFGINIITNLSGIPDGELPDPNVVRSQHEMGFSQGCQATNAAWPHTIPKQMDELIRHMVANHIALAPTLWSQKVLATLGEETPEKDEAVKLSHAPPSILERWQRSLMDVGDPAIYKTAWPDQINFVRAFEEAGGLLVTGTDTPNSYVAPGLSLHQEMETFIEAGITPFDALKAATVNASRALGQEDHLGSVEIGNRADLVLIEGNPLEDVKNARHIRLVFRSGNPYDPAKLLAGLPR